MIDPLTIPAFRKLSRSEKGAYLLVVRDHCDSVGVAREYGISASRARQILNSVFDKFNLKPFVKEQSLTNKLLRMTADYRYRECVARTKRLMETIRRLRREVVDLRNEVGALQQKGAPRRA